MPPIHVKVGGAWKEVTPHVKVGGVWKEVDSAHVKVGGAWKECHSGNPVAISTPYTLTHTTNGTVCTVGAQFVFDGGIDIERGAFVSRPFPNEDQWHADYPIAEAGYQIKMKQLSGNTLSFLEYQADQSTLIALHTPDVWTAFSSVPCLDVSLSSGLPLPKNLSGVCEIQIRSGTGPVLSTAIWTLHVIANS